MPRHRFTNTRDRIETAAVHLFVDKGVADTTVRDIARALEMSEGALYRHFPSKEQLVWQVFERHYIEFAAMIRGFCRAYDENPRLFRFLLFVQHDQLGKLAPDTPTPVEAVRMVIGSGIASGEIPPQNADLATSLVFGVVLQPVQFAAYGRLPADMGSVSERLVAAAWAAVSTV